MSSKTVTLSLAERSVTGKKVKQIRSQGLVPVVISERGKDSLLAQGVYLEVERAFQAAGKHMPVHVSLAGKQYLVMLKEATLDPVKHRINHVALHAVKQNEKVDAIVAIRIIGEVPAERAGLTVLDTLREVEVEALPADLPEVMEVDGSVLVAVGDKLHVSDLIAVKGVAVISDAQATIAVVEMPRDAESEAAEAAEAAAQQVSAADVPADNGTEKPAAE
jgi:large subunit ribosomal protein L25